MLNRLVPVFRNHSVLVNSPIPAFVVPQQCRGIQLFDIFSKERMEKREQRLKDELRRGFFQDFKDLSSHPDGKVPGDPIGPVSLKEAPEFPSLVAENMLGDKSDLKDLINKFDATFVVTAIRASGQAMASSWLNAIRRDVVNMSPQRINAIELVILDMYVMRKVPGLIASSLRSQRAPSYHANTFLHSDDPFEFRKQLSINNRLISYCFLVDRDGMVRWRSQGMPDDADLVSLVQTTRAVLTEAKAKKSQLPKL